MVLFPTPIWYSINLLNTFLFFISFFILIPQLVSRKNILTIALIGFISSGMDYYWGNSSLIIVLLTVIYFFSKTNHQLWYKISIFLICLLVTSFTENLADTTVFNILKFESNNMTMENSIIPFLLIILFNYIFCIIIISLIKSILPKTTFIFKDKTVTIIILNSIAIMTVIYFFLILLSQHLKLNVSFLKLSLSISLIAIFFIITGAAFLINIRIKEIKISSELKQLKERNVYIKELERKNNELRRFKHDYKNFLLSLSASLNSNNINNDSIRQLLKYADTNIDSTLNTENGNLYNLHDELIRGIIITKLMVAKNNHIKTNFEIDKDPYIPNNFSVEITRILGILLDNAIDACLTSIKPELDFALISFDNYTEFIIKNSIQSKSNIDLNKIYYDGYTTKTDHSGLGLSTVRKIIKSNSALLLKIKLDDNFFTITLTTLKEK